MTRDLEASGPTLEQGSVVMQRQQSLAIDSLPRGGSTAAEEHRDILPQRGTASIRGPGWLLLQPANVTPHGFRR